VIRQPRTKCRGRRFTEITGPGRVVVSGCRAIANIGQGSVRLVVLDAGTSIETVLVTTGFTSDLTMGTKKAIGTSAVLQHVVRFQELIVGSHVLLFAVGTSAVIQAVEGAIQRSGALGKLTVLPFVAFRAVAGRVHDQVMIPLAGAPIDTKGFLAQNGGRCRLVIDGWCCAHVHGRMFTVLACVPNAIDHGGLTIAKVLGIAQVVEKGLILANTSMETKVLVVMTRDVGFVTREPRETGWT
jgi:hypothetical protein